MTWSEILYLVVLVLYAVFSTVMNVLGFRRTGSVSKKVQNVEKVISSVISSSGTELDPNDSVYLDHCAESLEKLSSEGFSWKVLAEWIDKIRESS